MSADRATDAVEAASTSKLHVPCFSSYQPAALRSSNSRHHASDQQIASSGRSHRRPRKRRRHHGAFDDSARPKDVPERARSSGKTREGKDRGEGGSSRDGWSSQKKNRHYDRESKRERRSHRTSSLNRFPHEASARSPTPPTFDRNLFYSDTRGDRDALVYGQDRSKLPRAHRVFEPAIGMPSRGSATSTEKQHLSEPPDKSALPRRGVALEPAEDFIGIDSASSDDTSEPLLSSLEHRFQHDQERLQTATSPQPSSSSPSEPSILSLLARRPREAPTGLYDLPLELVHRILVLSRSASLPVASQRLRRACQHASIADKVDYALGRWADHYVAYRTANVCRDKHRACRSFASRLLALWREFPMWYELANEMLGPSPLCTAHAVRMARLDVITFVAELRVCDSTVLQRVVSAVRSSPLSDAVLGDPTLPPLLPKRLFRRIEFSHFPAKPLGASGSAPPQEATDTQKEEDQAGSKRKKKRPTGGADATDTNANETPSTPPGRYPGWLLRLLDNLASVRPQRSPTSARATDLVGPIPSAADLELLWVLLCSYGADASSHAGYPLAMAVHRGSYALVHMLLLFGADPHCKDGLAAQIAIRNGELDILHLLVTGPCLELHSILSEVQDIWRTSRAPQLQLNQTHLRLAIQSKHWNIVDYLWHEQNVSPDIACLKLIEKLRQ